MDHLQLYNRVPGVSGGRGPGARGDLRDGAASGGGQETQPALPRSHHGGRQVSTEDTYFNPTSRSRSE